MENKLSSFLPKFTANDFLLTPFIFWLLSMTANFFNWLFNMQAGRSLSKEEFASLTVLLSFQYLFNVPAAAFSATVARFTAFYREKGEQEKHFNFFRQYWWLSWALGLTLFLLLLAFQSFLKSFFGFDSRYLIYIFSLGLIPMFLLSFERGTLFGQMAFTWVGVLLVVEAGAKFAFLYIGPWFSLNGFNAGVIALPLSLFAAWFVSILVARSYHPLSSQTDLSPKSKLNDTYKFLGNSFFAGLGSILIYSMDVLLVKHFFPPYQAGVYSTLSLMGKTLYFTSAGFIGLLIPLTARAQAKKQNSRKPFYLLLSLVLFVGAGIWLSYLFFPGLIITKLLTEKGLVILPYLTVYSLGMLFLVVINCFITYALAKKNYLPVRITLVAALIEAALISFHHQTLSQVVSVVTFSLFSLLLTLVAVEFLGITSFSRLFIKEKKASFNNKEKIKILIFNWRDLKHTYAGGAEVYLQEIGKRLVQANFQITLFTANDGRLLADEQVDGINIIRRGGFITVYFWAVLYYLFKFRGKFDLVLDSENGIPFFTPLFVRKPVILLVHHLHQDVFFQSLLPPISWIANFLETYLMPRIYQGNLIVSVSNSTAEDLLQKTGLKTTSIIKNGVDTKKYRPCKKSKTPLISYVGRLKKYKNLEVLLLAFKRIINKKPQARLSIAGAGDNLSHLKKKAFQLGIEQNVLFLGKISQQEKIKLLGRSWVMVQPSSMEGWGITCLEANACGSLVLASNVPGLKDAVCQGVNGYLFGYGDDLGIARMFLELVKNAKKRKLLGKSARQWSKKYGWKPQAEKLIFLIKTTLGVNGGVVPLTFLPLGWRKQNISYAHQIKINEAVKET